MTQLALELDDSVAALRPIVAEELAREAVVTGVARQRFHIVVSARWLGRQWIVDINPRRVLCRAFDGSTSPCHPTDAYAGMFEAGA